MFVVQLWIHQSLRSHHLQQEASSDDQQQIELASLTQHDTAGSYLTLYGPLKADK